MARLEKWLAAAVLVVSFVGPVFAGGNANFVLGSRSLDDDEDWAPIDNQPVIGATVDFGREGWPISLAIGVYVSSEEDDARGFGLGSFEFTGTLRELSFGVLKTFEPSGNIRPFIGGGASALTAEIEVDLSGLTIEEDDTSIAFYGQGGVYWRIGSRFNIGVDVRLLEGSDLSIEGVDFDGDYTQIGLLLGWGWPGT